MERRLWEGLTLFKNFSAPSRKTRDGADAIKPSFPTRRPYFGRARDFPLQRATKSLPEFLAFSRAAVAISFRRLSSAHAIRDRSFCFAMVAFSQDGTKCYS
jgi:hypothetical protein